MFQTTNQLTAKKTGTAPPSTILFQVMNKTCSPFQQMAITDLM